MRHALNHSMSSGAHESQEGKLASKGPACPARSCRSVRGRALSGFPEGRWCPRRRPWEGDEAGDPQLTAKTPSSVRKQDGREEEGGPRGEFLLLATVSYAVFASVLRHC